MHESLPQRTLRQSFFGFFRRVLITSACCLSKQKRPHPQAAALLHLLCQILSREISVFTAILFWRPYQSMPGEMSQSTTTQISLQCRFDI
jgi:hypothetical protein